MSKKTCDKHGPGTCHLMPGHTGAHEMPIRVRGPRLNFRVARNTFGDYWVGLTDEVVDGRKVFASFKEAKETAVHLTDGRDMDDEDKYAQIDEIKESSEDGLEVVPPVARW